MKSDLLPCPVFEFDRYSGGELKADGIRITQQRTLRAAISAATLLADRGDVLVWRVPSHTLSAALNALVAEVREAMAPWRAACLEATRNPQRSDGYPFHMIMTHGDLRRAAALHRKMEG